MLYASTATAQKDYDIVFNKSYPDRNQIFDTLIFPSLINLPQDSFDKQMDVLEQKAKDHNDKGVELEVLLARFEYKDYHGKTDPDKKLQTFEGQLKTIDHNKYEEYVILMMMELGNNYYGKKHNYSKAFENYINAQNLLYKYTSANFPTKKDVFVNISNRYYNIGDLAKAKTILHGADTIRNSWLKTVNYNNKNTLGLIHRQEGHYDSAVYYFEKTEELAKLEDDHIWEAIAIGNIGISYYLMGEYDKAVPYLEKDYKTCLTQVNAYDNGVHSLLILADINLTKNNIVKVAEQIQIAKTYIDSTRDIAKHLADLYPVLAKYYYKKGDYKIAYEYKDSAARYKDSLTSRDDIYKLAKVAQKLEIEKHLTLLEQLNTEKKLIKRTRNGLILVIGCAFAIILLIINRRRLQLKIAQNDLLNKNRLAEHDLKNAEKRLRNYTQSIQEKNTIIEKSADEIKRLEENLSNSQKEQYNNEVLQQLYASTILTDEEWEEFKQLFDQVYTGYLHRLKEKMPELSPADTRFMVLNKLKLSNKEMAAILGVQPDSIRTYKHRLRKKFNLSEEVSIIDFADTI